MRQALQLAAVEEEAVSASGPAVAELRALYEAHAPFLRNVLARLGGPELDPDDLLHEVFLVALRRPDALRRQGEPRAWLYGVAVKVAQAARRRGRLRRFLGLETVEERADPHTPHSTYEKAESSVRVHAALEGLSEKKRTVFILFELEGMSGEEIAGVVGCPVKTVWTRLYHARREFLVRLQRAQAREGG